MELSSGRLQPYTSVVQIISSLLGQTQVCLPKLGTTDTFIVMFGRFWLQQLIVSHCEGFP